MRSDKTAMMIELLTGLIIKAFSVFAPKRAGCRMGTGQMGAIAGLFHPTFFPTSENFSSFFTFILYTLSAKISGATRPKSQAYSQGTPVISASEGSATAAPIIRS